MDWLKELLKDYVEEGKVDEVVDKFNKENPKHFMPKQTFNEKSEELRLAKEQIEENKKLLEAATQKASTIEDYEKNLNEFKQKYEQLEQDSNKRISEISKKTDLKIKLSEFFIEDSVGLILDKVNLDEVKVGENNKIENFDIVLEGLKKNYPRLAKETTSSSATSETKEEETQRDTSNMNDEEYYKQQGVKPLW